MINDQATPAPSPFSQAEIALKQLAEARAEKLAVMIETIAFDLKVPIEVNPRFNQAGELDRFSINCSFPTARIPRGETEAASAAAIATQLDAWAAGLTSLATAVRNRIPQQ